MSDTTTGKYAFPAMAICPSGDLHQQEGMTLRQYYAGQALGALITSHLAGPANYFDEKVRAAEEAFKFADAMIAAGEQ